MAPCKLIITHQQCLADIIRAFQTQFPYLKLAFYKKHDVLISVNSKTERLPGDTKINTLVDSFNEVQILLQTQKRVFELIEEIYIKTGLYAQLFRKSGRSWLKTTLTDDWTLERQNSAGYELSQI